MALAKFAVFYSCSAAPGQHATLDIDHALPWAAWPCSDRWNLLPAHRRVNQHQKHDLLPERSHHGSDHRQAGAPADRTALDA